MNKLTKLLGTGLLALFPFSVEAHEFWIAPADYSVNGGDPIIADLQNGDQMSGVAQPYIDSSFARFDIAYGDVVVPVPGRLGDQPAMTMPALAEGLAIVVYQTAGTTLTYQDYAIFNRFVGHKSLNGVLAQHAARGLPDTGFQESYRRYAKSLIAVGAGAGSDRAFGLKVEIVALTNPYTDDLSAGMRLRVLLDGQPRSDAQLELFGRGPDGVVTRVAYRTDAQGMVTVTVEPGVEYLADNVAMTALPNDDPAAGPVWHSDWASLTFQVPLAP